MPDLDPSLCNNNALRQASRSIGLLYEDIVAPSGLRATQYGLLAYIASLSEPAMKELAQALVMDLSALGHTLKPLTRDGLVELVPDVRDRRVKRVRLTAEGVAKLKQATALWRQAQNRFEAAFGVDKAAELRAVLSYAASEEFRVLFRQQQAT
jgi:DNA-binding MarR family transcriptional regulator